MQWLLAVAGFGLGGLLGEFPGGVSGALLGYLLGRVSRLTTELGRLRGELAQLRGETSTARPAAQEPPRPASEEPPATEAMAAAPAGAAPFAVTEPGPVASSEPAPSPAPAEPRRSDTPPLAVGASAGWDESVPPRKATPSPASWLGRALQNFLTGGNLVVKVGVVVLFFGLAFLLKYAAEHAVFPPELRVIATALGGMALLGIGWRLRGRRPAYALALQGGGVGILYLTVFAALRLHALLPAGPAFALMAGIAAGSAALAVLQDALWLAVLGVVGGFLAPVLISTSAGDHVALFSYYALLNLGILAVAWFRPWRILHLVGFVFTFAIATTWGVLRYRPELFASTEPFLILFFLLYVTVAVLHARRQPPHLRGYADGSLVFGTPLVCAVLQGALVREMPYGMAWSALAAGAFYLGLAWTLWRRGGEGMRLLSEAFLAIGVVFVSLAIPLALDGRWTAAAWALEGLGILWVGIRQGRALARGFAVLLQLASGAAYLIDLPSVPFAWPLLNVRFLGVGLLAVAGLASAYLLDRHRERLRPLEIPAAALMLAWGLAWWFGGGLSDLDQHVSPPYEVAAMVAFVAGSGGLLVYLEGRLPWPALHGPGLALLPALAVLALLGGTELAHPGAGGGYAAWGLALAVHYASLAWREQRGQTGLHYLHAGGLWLVTALLSWELAWALGRVFTRADTGEMTGLGLAALPLVWAVLRLRLWPFDRPAHRYRELGLPPVAGYLTLWMVAASIGSAGDPQPLSYLPLLNPLDLTQGLALATLAYTWLTLHRAGLARAVPPPLAAWALGGLGFLWLNTLLLRALHQWGDIPYRLDSLFDSGLVQATVAIFWTLCGVAGMVVAARRRWQALWLVAAGLLGVVVLKLFVVDLAYRGTVERIVAFIAVGLLLLVVGYVSPMPPRPQTQSEARAP